MAAKEALVLCLLISCWAVANCYPFHASCRLSWKFSVPCKTVYGLIEDQMQKWNLSTLAACKSENHQKCGYSITSYHQYSEIIGTHTTPTHQYTDDLTMKFTNSTSSSCTVKGYSTARVFYAVLDNGTNYCNLHNLVVGSGLTNASRYGFEEVAENRHCTQYSTANCNKY